MVCPFSLFRSVRTIVVDKIFGGGKNCFVIKTANFNLLQPCSGVPLGIFHVFPNFSIFSILRQLSMHVFSKNWVGHLPVSPEKNSIFNFFSRKNQKYQKILKIFLLIPKASMGTCLMIRAQWSISSKTTGKKSERGKKGRPHNSG